MENVLPTQICVSCIFAICLQSDFLGLWVPSGVTLPFLPSLLLYKGSRALTALQQGCLVGSGYFNLDFKVLNLYFFS